MSSRRYLFVVIAIIFVFAIGLIGYFAFSAAYGDGLEKTMEDSGVEEGEPFWTAPFSYGDDYLGALFAGALGFALVSLLVLGYLLLVKRRRNSQRKVE